MSSPHVFKRDIRRLVILTETEDSAREVTTLLERKGFHPMTSHSVAEQREDDRPQGIFIGILELESGGFGLDCELTVYLREAKDQGQDQGHAHLVCRADVVLDAATLGLEVCVAVICAIVRKLGFTNDFRRRRVRKSRDFAHPSEGEFARLLDFYQIRYEYEPKTFPLEWDENGAVTEAFTPDFYLPDFDLYIELTTLKQNLVSKKNRKIRRFRELYPDVSLKVLYGRDYLSLLRRWGIDLAE